ncbi:cytochrome c oxidase subunit 7A2-like, mitochondrial [Asterias amurensis]|uniref:cytochrome c oxidase subunit 7A2-like, mitochondrial n=1 Tax=Asterias amurensis TaxID=7602 RepID=UPI003AB73024
MAYKFRPMGGRVGPATPEMAYSPAGLQPPVKVEPSQLVWEQKPKPVAIYRSPMGGDGVFGKLNKVYQNQKVFQSPNGIPIHLKKGFTDRLSFGLIMALTVGGTIWTCVSLYQYSQPKK